MNIRPYRSKDCHAMAKLFYDTVHSVNAADYEPRQLDAWADGQVDLEAWDASFRAHTTLVAQWDGLVAGFADLADVKYAILETNGNFSVFPYPQFRPAAAKEAGIVERLIFHVDVNSAYLSWEAARRVIEENHLYER